MDKEGIDWAFVNDLANSLTQEQRDDAERRIRNASKIPMRDFQIAIGVLFAIASLAFCGRIAIRLATRSRVFLDDCFLILSFVCLIVATILFYLRARLFYLAFSLMSGDLIASLIASQHIEEMQDTKSKWIIAYVFFLWTTIFMVKFCYFAFFYTLIRSMPRGFIWFYWSSVVFTVIAWIFLVLQQLIPCPYFGSDAVDKCYPVLPQPKAVLTFIFCMGPVLDALTDAAIISIPIFVLRKSQMKWITKAGFGVFLCLSLFMLACSITRAAGTWYKGTLDSPWQVFWLHAEACIGVFMASITVYRSVLIGATNKSSYRLQQFIDKIMQKYASNESLEAPESEKTSRLGRVLSLANIRATLTGLGTMFGTHTRFGHEHPEPSAVDSTIELTQSSYHEYLRDSHTGNYMEGTNDVTNDQPSRLHS